MENKSVIRTKKLIKEATAELIQSSDNVSKITISDIAKKAGINRGTFYLHYSDIFSLVKDIENDIICGLKKILDAYQDKRLFENIVPFLTSINEFMKENSSFYRKLLSSPNSKNYIERIKHEVICEIMRDKELSNIFNNESTLYIYIDFFVNGIIGLYHDYFKSDLKTSLDDILSIIIEMVYGNLRIIVDKSK